MKLYSKKLYTNLRLTLIVALLAAMSNFGASAAPVMGNISPSAIEIDASANLYPASNPCGLAGFVNGPILNSGATADWVKDCAPNSDPKSLVNSIASGIIPGTTGAAGGTGHWNGVRIVDGINGNDQDIFLTGGKENDFMTWNVGPGTVGSPKYDITQAYLANNQQTLFFGMERRGNNGTTAFDFEFNQAAPAPSAPYIPNRRVGDVLFTFEMQGSGSSGSAVPHYYRWDGTRFVEQSKPSSLISSINNTETPAGPWGFVNDKGEWVLGTIPRFEFAEAAVNLAQAFPGFEPCGRSVFVQIRTRSSATENSDLKDTTNIFEYRFLEPTAAAALNANCLQQFTYNGTASRDTNGGTSLTYRWDFKAPTGVTLSGTGITGPDASGLYHATQLSGTANVGLPAGVNSATITAVLTVAQGAACTDSTTTLSVTVLRRLTAAILKGGEDGNTLTVTLNSHAPTATALQWQRMTSSGAWVNISGATRATLAYSSFEADSTPTVKTFTIDGAIYAGKLYQVPIRLYAVRVANGATCDAVSAPIILKKVIAVDP